MKYEARNSKVKFDQDNPQETLLEINGIKDVEDYMNAGSKDFSDVFGSYVNASKAFNNYYIKDTIGQKVYDRIKKVRQSTRINVGIVVDCDVDGFCSSALAYNYYNKRPNMNVTPLFHTGKQHGLSEDIMDQISQQMFDIIVIPDAGSNDVDQCTQLSKEGTFVEILDHHEIDVDNPYAAITNPYRMTDKSFTDLSGTAVTFMFLSQMPDFQPTRSEIELVALSLISDSMDCRSVHNRWILDNGFNHYPTHPLLKTIVDNDRYNAIDSLNPDYCSFNIVPKMNALIRMGSQEDKEYLFRAICGEDITFDHKKRDGSIEKESLAMMVSRIGKNAQARQTTAVGKDVKILSKYIDENHLADNKVLVIDSTDINSVLKGITGARISSHYNRPVIIGEYGEDNIFHGSIRNNCDYIDDFKAMLDKTNLCTVAGHENAAGITFKKDDEQKIIDNFNTICSAEDYEKTYYIDGNFYYYQINSYLAMQIDSFKKYSAPGIERPKFLIRNVLWKGNVDIIGKNNNTCKFSVDTDGDNVEFIKFSYENSEIDKLIQEWYSDPIDVIGQIVAKYDTQNGTFVPQVIIEDVCKSMR